MFGLGFLLGKMSNTLSHEIVSNKIDDKCKYSCEWWIEKTKANCSKAKMCTVLMVEYRNGQVFKNCTREGLTIFVPKNNDKELIEKISKKLLTNQ